MSTSLSLGLVIGASVAAGFQTAMLTVNNTVEKLKKTTESLNIRQEQLHQKIKSLPEGASGLVKLKHEYDALGKTIERVARHQISLNKSIETAKLYKQQREDLRTNIAETAAIGTAMLLPVYGGVKTAGNHEDNVKDIAITGEFDATQEAQLSKTIRAVSLQMNQTADAISAGAKSLVGGGLNSVEELDRYLPVLGKMATATRGTTEEIATMFLALKNNMGVAASDIERSMNIITKGSKLGRFESKDLAKWLPDLTPDAARLGITGEKGVAQLVSALETVRMNAGSSDSAANMFKNLLGKVVSMDTEGDFKKVGIDLEASLAGMASQGINPLDGILSLVDTYVSKAAVNNPQLKKLLDEAEKEHDPALKQQKIDQINAVSGSFSVGKLFQDREAMGALVALRQHKAEYQEFQKQMLASADAGLLNDDYNKRMAGFNEQIKKLKISLVDIGMTIGETLIPPILNLVAIAKPWIEDFAIFAKSHPDIIQWGAGILAGGIALKLFASSLAYVFNLIFKSPFNQAVIAFKQLTAVFTLSKVAMTNLLPVMAKLGSGSLSVLAKTGTALLTVGKYLLAFGKGLGMGLGMPIFMIGKGVAWLSVLLAGKLVSGIKIAAQAFMVLGRALFLTPIGLIIAGVAALAYGAYQLYQNWEPIKAWFSDLWQNISDAIWENTALMGMTIEGWIGGIKSWFAELKTWFTNLWDSLIGDALTGITELKSQANKLLPEPLKFDVKPLDVPEPSHFNSTRGNVIDQSTVNFTPNIVLPAGTPEQTVSSVKQALSISQTEFEQRYKQMQRNNQRLNFAGQ